MKFQDLTKSDRYLQMNSVSLHFSARLKQIANPLYFISVLFLRLALHF